MALFRTDRIVLPCFLWTALLCAAPVLAEVEQAGTTATEAASDPPEPTPLPEPPTIEVREVTVTTTRSEQDVLKVPANVTIIDRKTIEASGVQTVPDLLRREAGIYVQNTTTNPEGFTVETRGFNNGSGNGGRTLVLIDNRPVNEPGSGSPDWSFISLDNIERIEVVRGPVSAVWGDHAIGGVVHIITRHPTEDGIRATLRGRSGSYDFDAGSVFLEGKQGAISATAFFDDYKTKGYRERSDFRNKKGEMDLRFAIGDRGYLKIKGGYSTSLRQRPGALSDLERKLDRRQAEPGTSGDFDSARERFVEAELDLRLADFLKVYLHPYHRRLTDLASLSSFSSFDIMGFGSFDSVFDFTTDSEEDELGLLGQLQFDFDILGRPNRLVVGGDVIQEDVDSDSLFTSTDTFTSAFGGPPTVTVSSFPGSSRARRKSWAVFVQNDLDIHDRVTLSFGVRRDRVRIEGRNRLALPGMRDFSTRQTAWGPRAGITLRVAEPVSIYASYSRGFRFPNLNEVFLFFGTTSPLRPEKSDSYEVGVKVRTERVSFNAAIYTMNVQDEIFFDPFAPPFGDNVNLARVRHRGIELSANWRPCDWLELYGSYTYDGTKFTRDKLTFLEGNRIPITPRHRGTAGFRLFLPYGFEAGLNANYVGARFLANDLREENEKLGKFASYDARIAWKGEITEWLEVGADLTAHNLTNRRYTENGGVSSFSSAVGFFPSPDRHYVAGVRMTLKR